MVCDGSNLNIVIMISSLSKIFLHLGRNLSVASAREKTYKSLDVISWLISSHFIVI